MSNKTLKKNNNIFEFIKNKLIEAEQRHKKFGSSRFLIEPNVKEGKEELGIFKL